MINTIKEQIKSIAASRAPEEACGLIVKSGNELICFECKNLAENKLTNFIIDGKDYIKAARFGSIEALFHSQENDFNDGESQLDIINSRIHKIPSIVYSWKTGSFFEINHDTPLKDYLNVKFEIGKNDCFTLVQNYYNKELNIKINNYTRDNNWDILNPSIIEDSFPKEGFVTVSVRDIEKNDILLFSVGTSEASHIGIYLGDNMFLHHPRNKYPAVEFLGRSWSNRVKFILRHKNFIKENHG